MKHILVPTDFSDFGKIAESVGIAIAEQAKASIDFLHLMHVPQLPQLSATVSTELPEEIKVEMGKAQQYLNELNKRASDKGLNSRVYLSNRSSVEEVKTHIEKHQIDLVVMGTHGASGFREAILGSNTQKVLRTALAPVLVLKEMPAQLNFKKLVFASTFREDVHAAFAKVSQFAATFGAEIHLLYVNMPYNFEETQTSMERINKFTANYPNNQFKTHIYNAFDEETGILKFAHLNNIDIIATTTHGKSGFVQMMSPSITESLANHSSLPVLSVNVK